MQVKRPYAGDHSHEHEASRLCAGVPRVVKQLVGLAIEEGERYGSRRRPGWKRSLFDR